MRYGAVIVETRHYLDLPRIIEQHMEKLPRDWGLTVFTTGLNIARVWKHFPHARVIDLEQRRLPSWSYSELLTCSEFWEALPYEKVLIFQHDSRLLRPGIEEFLEWDYVGSPWTFQEHGGNGGLSLRTSSIMRRIIKRQPYNPLTHGGEDLYFCNRVSAVGGKLAPRDVCARFSCETIFQLGTLGCHNIERHMTASQVASIVNQYADRQPDSNRPSLRRGHPANRTVHRGIAPLSPEQQVIADCIRGVFDGSEAPRIAEVAWDRIPYLATNYGVTSLVRDGLAASGQATPDHVRLSLQAGHALETLRLRDRTEPGLRCTLGALKAAGLEPVVLKGVALAYWAYPRPVHRTFGDVDLLLPPEQVAPAGRALVEGGFATEEIGPRPGRRRQVRVHHDRERRVAVALHDQLLDARSPYAVSVERCLERSQAQTIAGVEVRVLAPTDALLHVCVDLSYGHSYRWFPLRSLTDILALTTSGDWPDWDDFVRTVRASRTGGAVYWPLQLSRRWLGAPVPDRVLAELAPPRPLRGMIAAITDPGYILDGGRPGPPGADVLFDLIRVFSPLSGCSPRRQAEAVLNFVVPPRHTATQVPPHVTTSRARYAGYLASPGRIARGVAAFRSLLASLPRGDTAAAPPCRGRADPL